MLSAPPQDVPRSADYLADVIMTASKMSAKRAILLAQAVSVAGAAHDIDPVFLLALSYTESRWVQTATGDKGRSIGIYQLTLSAARSVAFGGHFEDKPSQAKVYRSRSKQRTLLRDVWVASRTAAAYLARLRRRHGARADVVYNCGPTRCGVGRRRLKHTRATRAYWRNYRKLLLRLNSIEKMDCVPSGVL